MRNLALALTARIESLVQTIQSRTALDARPQWWDTVIWIAALLLALSASFVHGLAIAAEPSPIYYAGRLDVVPGDACTRLKDPEHAGMDRALFVAPDTFYCSDAGGRRSRPFSGEYLCALASGYDDVSLMKGVLTRKGNSFGLRCLYAPVDLRCAPPSAGMPQWPRPVMSSQQDDHCDLWKRGPAPPLESSRLEGAWQQPLARQIAQVAPLLDFETPRLMPARIVNPLYDADGNEVAVPEVSLRRALGGRTTLAALALPGCDRCVQVIETLHKGLTPLQLGKGMTSYEDAQLVILVPKLEFSDMQINTLIDDIRQRFPGRPVWAIDRLDGMMSQPLMNNPPWLAVIDANGYVRASTSARVFPGPQQTATWAVLRNPSRLLNVALQSSLWEAPRAAKLQATAEALSQGRMSASVAAAPDSIELPAALLKSALEWGTKGAAEQTEYGAELLLEDGKGVRLAAAEKGLALRVVFDGKQLRDEMLTLLPCADCPAVAHKVGIFHTHPNEGWYSEPDIFNAVVKRHLSLLTMRGGLVGLLLPTHELHDLEPPVNLALDSERRRTTQQLAAWSNFYAYGSGDDLRQQIGPSQTSAIISTWGRTLNVATDQLRVAIVQSAYNAAQLAQSAGLALYVGHGTQLQRVSLPVSAGPAGRSWTGNGPGMVGEERGLSPSDRTVIAGLLRARVGDQSAFCEASLDDVFLPSFSPASRALIKQLPAVMKARNPYAPPMVAAAQGYFNDEDLQAFLTMLDGTVEQYQGHFMHLVNRTCVMHWTNTEIDLKTSTRGPSLWLGKAKNMYDDGGTARSFTAILKEQQQSITYGDGARAKGCVGIALRNIRQGEAEPVRCDALLKP